ncbi:DUF2384 domain-containing protein [Modestobacter sp. VKM Ac-2983]|uniref:antitoxin Xre/MbcA/ParS toxin-binding domain-containing protein n=1 Tax=Modestobacter sp. VKM Ac-2983 TaxID=3004137 RepID=UPI0022AB72FC|nr:antitoxin Xre/MbcA/ParS toxin-binding domain-containing protein [Modestobacter sp. VKM Ac-2983]MCZ2807599.1 DUF2384 domain-containing protein [Modestobacter sp. VKM Ac-2983]
MSTTHAASAASSATPHASSASSPLYQHVVADTRRALTLVEIGEIVGAGERAIQKWAAGTARPEGAKRDRLLELQYVIEELSDVYRPEGVEIWLHSPQRALQGRRPLDVLKTGEFQTVLKLVQRLAGGPKVR